MSPLIFLCFFFLYPHAFQWLLSLAWSESQLRKRLDGVYLHDLLKEYELLPKAAKIRSQLFFKELVVNIFSCINFYYNKYCDSSILLITKRQSMLWLLSHNALVVLLYFFNQQFLLFLFPTNNGKISWVWKQSYLSFLSYFAENRPCHESFKCGKQITCTKSFFVKLHGPFVAHAKSFGQAI